MTTNEHDPERRLSEHVRTRVDEARLARQWGTIADHLAKPRRPWMMRFVVPAVALAIVAVLVVVRPWGRTSVASATAGGEVLDLPDGSRVILADATRLALVSASADRIHLSLESGTVDVEATHRDGRSFVVSTAGHDVVVVGTRFVVRNERLKGRVVVFVSVQRGRVRIDGPSGSHYLDADQSWSATIDATSATAPLPVATDSVAAPTSAPAALAAPSASSIDLPDVPPPSATVAARPIPPMEGPRELLTRATDARAAGRHREAAAAYDAIRKRHRSDSRAGLAAFELGRIRLDALGDAAGAAEAFGDAIVLSPNAAFREDAEARRVDAFDAMGDHARCADARASYLARYPSGIHGRRLGQLCSKK